MLKQSWRSSLLIAALVVVPACKSQAKKTAVKPNLSAAAAAAAAAAPKKNKGTEITFPSGGLQLKGLITKPEGNGPFPAILYHHGSEQKVGTKKPVRDWFIAHNFVFFMPERPGQGHSPGEWSMDKIKKGKDRNEKDHIEVTVHEEGADVVQDALKYLKTVPYVDKNKIITGGCSFGGIQTLLAAERGNGVKLAIDWAGGAEDWRNKVLRKRLIKAVDNAKMPIFFLQAQNDYTTEPSETYSAEAKKAGKPYKEKIFPPHGTTHAEGHAGFCVFSPNEWSADVWAFIQQYLK
ncbi:MAG TPA: dienelactone hydrolase family protein [Byssovorax sp.]|jgi:dienelactone hydrolase